MEPMICIIEDDEGIRDVLKLILKKAGYITTAYIDGKAVMENHYKTPNLFLIDKQLPGVDGLTICKHLKQDNYTSAIPVIMMSAYPDVKQLAIESGADDFIEKPFHIENLISVIKKHMPVQLAK
jgi:DNA-binding response OmpR family regulator